MNKKRILHKSLPIFLALSLIFPWLAPLSPANALNLNRAYVRTDRMTASTATGGTVCIMANTTAGVDTFLEVTFPTGYTVNSTPGNWTVSTTNLPAGASAMPGIAVPGAGGVSGQTVRWTITDISNNSTLYCFNFSASNTLTTGTVGNDKTGSIRTYTGGTATVGSGTVTDTANYALAVISDDQIVVTATVPPTFSFALSSNTQALGTLSTSSVISGSGVNVTLGTNAGNGWLTWMKSLYTYLNSASMGDTIPTIGSIDGSPSTLSVGSKGYVVDCNLITDSATAGTGTVTLAGEYNGLTTSAGGTLSTNFQEVATANGPTDGDVIALVPRVTISALTKAATDYTDTLTVVGAANF